MAAPGSLIRLYQFILEHFDREDLRTLCFGLAGDYPQV